MFRFWRYREFALLWSGQLGSQLGSALFIYALVIYGYNLTGSAVVATAVFVASTGPSAVLSLFAGVVADRVDRRRLMITIDLSRGMLLLPLLTVHSRGQVWLLLVVTAANGALGSLFTPAYSALLPATLPREQLGPANGFFTATRSIVSIGGPAAGAAILAATGLKPLVLIDAVSFLGSVVTLALMTASSPPDTADGWRHQLSDGVRFVKGHRIAVVVITTSAIFGLAGGMLSALIVPFLRQTLHATTATTGVVFAVSGAGALLAGVAAGPLMSRFGARRVTIGSDVTAFAAIGVVTTAPNLTVALSAMSGVGISNGLYSTGLNTLLQTTVPPRFLGRVFGALTAVSSITSLLTAPLSVLIVAAAGTRVTLLTAFGIAAAAVPISVIGLNGQQARQLEDQARYAPGEEPASDDRATIDALSP